MSRRIFLFALVCLVIFAPNPTTGQNTLKIIDHPTLVVDPNCNAAGVVTGSLILRNDGSKKTAIHLSSDGLSSKSPAKQLTILPVFIPENGELGPRSELKVNATINGLHDDGDWAATIQNDKADVGTLRVIRTTPRFSISVDSVVPDQPELTFTEGKPGNFRLKNGDPQEYNIIWEYSVDGHVVRSKDPVLPPPAQTPGFWRRLFGKKDIARNDAVQPGSGALMIPAAGEYEVRFSPPRDWFGNHFAGLFKDQTADGRLVVSLIDLRCADHPTISKNFKIKTHLATSSGPWREAWGDLWVFIVLGCGGVFSLFLNSTLPNQMKRLKVKQQLSSMGAQISNLSYDLASRLRVLVGLEWRLIRDRLKNLTWTNPDFAGEIQGIEQAMNRLVTRLKFLVTLGTTRTNFRRVRSEVLPPSLTFSIEQVFEKIVQIGEKSDPTDDDVKMAQSLITNIQNELDRGILSNSDFANDLARKVKQYKQEFHPDSGRIGKTDTCKQIRQCLPGPFARLESTDETKIVAATDKLSVQNYIELDARLFALELIREYVDLVEGMAPDEPFRKTIEEHKRLLLDHLERRNCECMFVAELLVKQMKHGYFKNDIHTEITNGSIRIKADHGDIRIYEPCEFRLIFDKHPLNDAPARQEWTCRWTFSDPDGQVLIEEGWVVTHYFQRAIEYDLKIGLVHDDGTRIDVPAVEIFPRGKIKVSERLVPRSFLRVVGLMMRFKWSDAFKEWRKGAHKSARSLEYVRLSMTLIIALIGLMAGAKDQLLKLDVVPALLAVFLVGFGADQIKNLLTQKSPGADSNPNPRG